MIQGRWIENYQYVHWLKLPQLCPSGAMVNPVPVGYHCVWLAGHGVHNHCGYIWIAELTAVCNSVLLPVSEMTYTVSSGTLNPSIPYHTVLLHGFWILHTKIVQSFIVITTFNQFVYTNLPITQSCLWRGGGDSQQNVEIVFINGNKALQLVCQLGCLQSYSLALVLIVLSQYHIMSTFDSE